MSDLALGVNEDQELIELPPLQVSENPIREPGPLELYSQTMARRTIYIASAIGLYILIVISAVITEGTLWNAPDYFTSNQWVSFYGYSCMYLLGGLALTLIVSLYFTSWIVILPDNTKYYLKDFRGKGKEVGPGLVNIKKFFESAFKEVEISSMYLYIRSTVTTTKDGIPVVAHVRITYVVENLRYAIFNISPFLEYVKGAAETKLNNVLSRNDYDFIQTDRGELEKQLLDAINKEAGNVDKPWGIKITNFEISDITPATKQARNMLFMVRLASLEAEGIGITYSALKEAFPNEKDELIAQLLSYNILSKGSSTPLVDVKVP